MFQLGQREATQTQVKLSSASTADGCGHADRQPQTRKTSFQGFPKNARLALRHKDRLTLGYLSVDCTDAAPITVEFLQAKLGDLIARVRCPFVLTR